MEDQQISDAAKNTEAQFNLAQELKALLKKRHIGIKTVSFEYGVFVIVVANARIAGNVQTDLLMTGAFSSVVITVTNKKYTVQAVPKPREEQPEEKAE